MGIDRAGGIVTTPESGRGSCKAWKKDACPLVSGDTRCCVQSCSCPLSLEPQGRSDAGTSPRACRCGVRCGGGAAAAVVMRNRALRFGVDMALGEAGWDEAGIRRGRGHLVHAGRLGLWRRLSGAPCIGMSMVWTTTARMTGLMKCGGGRRKTSACAGRLQAARPGSTPGTDGWWK